MKNPTIEQLQNSGEYELIAELDHYHIKGINLLIIVFIKEGHQTYIPCTEEAVNAHGYNKKVKYRMVKE